MKVLIYLLLVTSTIACASSSSTMAEQGTSPSAIYKSFATQKARDRAMILEMSGCFQVDYSYSEVESLKEGYTIDPRVYDVTKTKTVKECMMVLEESENTIRLQHVLFLSLEKDSPPVMLIRHHQERWSYEPGYIYEFLGNEHWQPAEVENVQGKWVREITDLDGGLRYQCAAAWDYSKEFPEWQCANFAPIPGRETRDMERKDYNSLDRDTRVIIYPNAWLERQNNTKVIFENGEKKPLAREVGKNFFIKLPKAECTPAISWAKPRFEFWKLIDMVWAEVLDGKKAYAQKKLIDAIPRYEPMNQIEEKYYNQLSKPEMLQKAKEEILVLIKKYQIED